MIKRACAGMFIAGFIWSSSASALELNWSGQFWSEYHFIKNYTLTSSDYGGTFDPARAAGDGYYIPAGGSNNATFESLFLRLRPKIVVNDNIYIKSEWWVGDPVFGIFGSGSPYPVEQRQFYSTQSRGSTISAQRFWAEFLSEVGTVQVGRAPLDWGLGIVWNSGEQLWSRYESTGDVIRLVSKFGAFSFTPSFILYSAGNNLGGSCTYNGTAVCTPGIGNGGVADYSLMLKYDNLEEDFEGGVNYIKRVIGSNQDTVSGVRGPLGAGGGSEFNTWDIYARKKLGKFHLAGEVPIASGKVSGMPYSTFALATELTWKPNDTWETHVKAGHAPGQNNTAASTFDRYRAFYFHPNYRLGLIMFNYQFANFAGSPGGNTQNNPAANPGGLQSPYDNPIVNANYFHIGETVHTDKWSFNLGWVYARALQTAETGQFFLNTAKKRISNVAAVSNQSNSLGWELDGGASFQWDEYFTFRWDFGFFFPGDYWKFSNVAGFDNETSTVFASVFRVGISF